MELELTHRPAAHCENGAISTLLRYHGIDLSEPMIFGLAYGIFFIHLPILRISGMDGTSFRTFPGALFKRITKMLGITTESHRFLNQEHAMRVLDRVLLEQHQPVGCVVGMYYLPYMPMEYRSHFNGHHICIIGKDEQTNQYSVLDANATEKVTIDRRDLMKARFAKRGVIPPHGQMFWIKNVPDELPDLRPLILKSIRKACWFMTSQPSFIRPVGVNGIGYLSDRIRHWDERMGSRRAMLNLAHLIRMLEEIGTGGAGFRFLYGAFLQEAAEATGFDMLNDYSRRITASGDLWREFSYKASRIIKQRDGERYTYNDLGDLLRNIETMERAFFTELNRDVIKIEQRK